MTRDHLSVNQIKEAREGGVLDVQQILNRNLKIPVLCCPYIFIVRMRVLKSISKE